MANHWGQEERCNSFPLGIEEPFQVIKHNEHICIGKVSWAAGIMFDYAWGWFNQHRLLGSQQIEIYSDNDDFHVYIDETKVMQYKHRVEDLKAITKLQVVNDVNISSLEITKKHLY